MALRPVAYTAPNLLVANRVPLFGGFSTLADLIEHVEPIHDLVHVGVVRAPGDGVERFLVSRLHDVDFREFEICISGRSHINLGADLSENPPQCSKRADREVRLARFAIASLPASCGRSEETSFSHPGSFLRS